MQKITLTVKEVAQLLGVSSTTIYTMARANEIPHAKIGGKVVFHRPTIEEWLINGATKSTERQPTS